MTLVPSIASRLGLVALLAAGPAWSQDAGKWSKVVNQSRNTYTIVNTDKAYTRGMLYIREAGEKGSGILLDEGVRAR